MVFVMGASSLPEDETLCSQHEVTLRENNYFCWDRSPNIFGLGLGRGWELKCIGRHVHLERFTGLGWCDNNS